MRGRLGDAATAMGGTLTGAADGRWQGAVLDSRTVAGAELFFALRGERTDGHRFAASALARGAAAAVVSRPIKSPTGDGEGPLIEVADTLEALHALTRDARRRAPKRLAAITGSTGKTTTKDLLAAMLEQRFKVGKSPGNFNNLLGFPISLLGIDEDDDWMVAEMGMSTPGELGQISRLGRPNVAVFTNVRPAHLEAFGSLRAIARAKAELLEGLETDGLVVVNADDDEVMWIADRHTGPVVRYGIETDDVEVAARHLDPLPPFGTRFELTWEGGAHPVELPLHGSYNVENCLAASAVALTAGVTLEEIARAVAGFTPAAGRGEVHRLGTGIVVIDDSYNSNPSALRRALEAAAAIAGDRHWAVLGDMLELGPDELEFHRVAGREAAAAGFAAVYGVGELARELAAAASDRGAASGWWPDAATAAHELPEPRAGDVILVKGSRGVGLEQVVARLIGERRGEA